MASCEAARVGSRGSGGAHILCRGAVSRVKSLRTGGGDSSLTGLCPHRLH